MDRMEKVSPWAFIGMGAMACLLFLTLASLRFAPWWSVAVLLLVWLVLFARACRWFAPAPSKVAWTAAAGLAVWIIAQIGGGLWLW